MGKAVVVVMARSKPHPTGQTGRRQGLKIQVKSASGAYGTSAGSYQKRVSGTVRWRCRQVLASEAIRFACLAKG